MNVLFYWIGVVATMIAVVGTAGLAALWIWANLIHRRFGLIFFATRPRRLSIAQWHSSRILPASRADEERDHWRADDFPVNQRPLLVTYRAGKRSYFVMAGYLAPRRHMPIEGRHPDA